MVTMPGRSGYRALFAGALLVLLAGCSAHPVLHEFPPALSASERPPAAVRYTLREDDERDDTWVLRGGEGAAVGTFRWERAWREADASAADRSEDFRRDDRFQDGINQRDYLFRLSATSDSLALSSSLGTAPPRVTVFDANGERIGQLELRTGFDRRYEGIWRGGAVLWRAELAPAGSVVRETDDGSVEDIYPAARLLQWTGGSNAGLKIFAGRAIAGEQFAEPIHDIQAGRPLTRRELGDAVTMLFAIRALEEAAAGANTLREMD